MRVTFSFRSTRIWRARSPSVRATRVLDADGSRRSISSATSLMTAVLPLSKLAHTRLFSGRGGGSAFLRSRAGDAKQAFHDLLWCAHPGCASEDSSNGGHALLVCLLPFSQPRRWLRAGRIDHGNALAVDGGHQNGAGGG